MNTHKLKQIIENPLAPYNTEELTDSEKTALCERALGRSVEMIAARHGWKASYVQQLCKALPNTHAPDLPLRTLRRLVDIIGCSEYSDKTN